MYSQAFDHLHDRHDRPASGLDVQDDDDEDAVYTDADSLKAEVQQDRLVQRRSRGQGTGFRKKHAGSGTGAGLQQPQCEGDLDHLYDDIMGQSHTTEVMEVTYRETSPQRYERARSDGNVLQQRQHTGHQYPRGQSDPMTQMFQPHPERGQGEPMTGMLRGHTEDESSEYCYAVEPEAQKPDMRKKPPVPQRSVSVKDDYSQPPDRLSHVRSQDYTEPYRLETEGELSPTKNPPDPGIYEYAKEPLHKVTGNSADENSPYNSTYNHITSGFDKAKLEETAERYDHLGSLHNQAHGAATSHSQQPRVTSPNHKHFNTPVNIPSSSGVKMQGGHTGAYPPCYEEPWDTSAGQRKLSHLLDKAEKTDERRQSLDKPSGQADQNIAKNVRRTAPNRNPSEGNTNKKSDINKSDNSAGPQGDLYETSWGPNVKRHSFERAKPDKNGNTSRVKTKTEDVPPPVKHETIPANYEDAWDLPEKQREFEEKMAKAREKRASEGQIRADDELNQPQVATPQSQKDKVGYMVDARFPIESAVFPTPRPKPVPAQRDRTQRSDSCRSLGALAEKIDKTIPLQDQIFYHGAIKRSDAEKMLLVFKEGSYLIRRSETSKKDYSLTLKGWNGIAMHMKIVTNPDGTYILGENSPPFVTIPEMVDYYTTHELPVQNAERICLLYPIPC